MSATTAAAQPAPVTADDRDKERFKNLKLKELLAHWNASISEQKRRFSDDADFVRRWDAQLRGSMVDLYHLETGVGELEQTCELIDRNLSEMEQNQVNIDTKLRKLEERMEVQLPQNRATGSYMDPTNTYQGAAQLARAQAYDAAIELGTLLDSLEDALDDVEQRVRLGQLEDNMHPLAQLRQILYENLRGVQQVAAGSEGLMSQSREIKESLRLFDSSGGGGN